MSKTSKTNLTGSRKRRGDSLPVDVHDDLNGRLRAIALLADLMGACQADLLPPGAMASAGELIAGEVRQIKAVLRKAGQQEEPQ